MVFGMAEPASKKSNVHWWMTAAGIAIVVGFFLPLLGSNGPSGWDMVWNGFGDGWGRLMVASVPVLGLGLIGASMARTVSAKWFALGAGGLIILYPLGKFVWTLVTAGGIGLLLTLGGGVVALGCGLVAASKK